METRYNPHLILQFNKKREQPDFDWTNALPRLDTALKKVLKPEGPKGFAQVFRQSQALSRAQAWGVGTDQSEAGLDFPGTGGEQDHQVVLVGGEFGEGSGGEELDCQAFRGMEEGTLCLAQRGEQAGVG